MTRRPAFQFYPADWRKDAELQSCSMVARGLWHEAMCIMHECEPYGELRVNGAPMSLAQLSRLVGMTLAECKRAMAELDEAGVPSRRDDGTIYSRRMVRDEAVRNARATGGQDGAAHGAKGAEHGKKGGRPKAETGDKKPPLYPPPSSSSSSSSSKEDIRDDGFQAFYEAYPRHEGRGQALKAYRLALKKADPPALLRAAQQFRARRAGEDQKFTPLPATWLNGERWLDEPNVTILATPAFENTNEAGWRGRMGVFASGKGWLPKWGPEPGQGGCRCPEDILAEYGIGRAA